MSGCYEYDIPTHILFIDFKRAYDTVNRTKLITTLRELDIPEKLINLIKMTLTDTVNRVKIKEATSETFEVKQGLRQGDPLSTTLFNLVLEHIIRKSGINRKGTLFNKSHQCLAYADDIAILARSRTVLEQLTAQLIKAAEKEGLELNIEKTKYMEVKNKTGSKNKTNLQIRRHDGEKIDFEEVESFMYLGVLVDNKCQEEKEIELRIAKSNNCAGSLGRFLKCKEISRKVKISVYKTIIRPTLTYACETWVMTNKIRQRLEIWERKMLRKIFGGKQTEYGWERRTNEELYKLYNDTNIISYIKMRRFQWLGHLQRMGNEREVKTVAWKVPEGKRRRGRPRKRWAEAIEEDLIEKGVQDWKKKAKDRQQWRKITKLWA